MSFHKQLPVKFLPMAPSTAMNVWEISRDHFTDLKLVYRTDCAGPAGRVYQNSE